MTTKPDERDYCWPGNCCGGANCQGEADQERIIELVKTYVEAALFHFDTDKAAAIEELKRAATNIEAALRLLENSDDEQVQRRPAETFPPGEFIRDEMLARGWSDQDVYAKLEFDPVRCCAFDLATYADDKGLILDTKTATDLALVFGTSEQYWINLDRAWRGAEDV